MVQTHRSRGRKIPCSTAMVRRADIQGVTYAVVVESGAGEGNAAPHHAAPLCLVLSLGGSGAVWVNKYRQINHRGVRAISEKIQNEKRRIIISHLLCNFYIAPDPLTLGQSIFIPP